MNEWEKQKNANILALLTASQYAERKQALEIVCRAFSETNITWALSMSSALFFKGIWDDFNDFDILIDISDVEEFEKVFTKIGGEIDHNTKQKEAFVSPYYKEAKIGDVHFDLIGDITIKTFNTIYCYPLRSKDVDYLVIEGDVNIPLCSVEANFLLYGMMEGWQSRRRLKRSMCQKYLHANQVNHADILQEALEGEYFEIQEEAKKQERWYLPTKLEKYVKSLINKKV